MAWWLNRTGQPEGPYEDQQLLYMIQSGQVRGGYIGQHGGNAWMPIEQHPTFGAALRGVVSGNAHVAPATAAPVATVLAKKSPALLLLVVGGLMAVLTLGGMGAYFALRKKSDDGVVGSCDTRKGTPAGMSPMCTDEGSEAKLKDCTGTQSDEPCDRTGAIAACKVETTLTWYYPGGDVTTPRQVETACLGLPVMLPDGSMLPPKSTAEELQAVLAEKGDKARTNLAGFAKLPAMLPAATTGKIDLGGVKNYAHLLVHAEDLQDLEHPKKLDYRLEASTVVPQCLRQLNNRGLPSDNPLEIHDCADYSIIIVIKVQIHKIPKYIGDTKDGRTITQHFEKGRIAGDTLVFRLDDGKYLGGYSFAVESSEHGLEKTLEDFKASLLKSYTLELFTGAQSRGIYFNTDLAKTTTE